MRSRYSESSYEREKIVLGTVVRGYVNSARAVGSRWVARHCGLGLSPASIRTCMMDLEEKGYLTHLHTSGGRLPTDSGYRLFVDEIMSSAVLAEDVQNRIDESLSPEQFGSLEKLLDQACTVLGLFSDQLSVVLSPRYDRGVVDRVELNQIDERRLLVVFRMNSGMERTVVLAQDEEIGSEDLRETVKVLNSVVKGKTLAEIRSLQQDEELRVRLRGLRLPATVFRGATELMSGEANEHFHLWGASNMLAQPEFADPERLRVIFRALEEKEVLYGLLEPTRHRKSVSIAIGDEIPVEELRECSVVSVSYRFGEFGGSVAVIGPTRMRYEYMVALVDYVARSVGKVLVRN